MTRQATANRIKGKTLRWTFAEGPQAGKTYQHTFHQDGTVEYRAIADEPNGASGQRAGNAGRASERPRYAAYAVSDAVALVSYRAESGFTLTVALNFENHELVAIASNSDQWFPAVGYFEEAGTPGR
jgi:hypothetical protein